MSKAPGFLQTSVGKKYIMAITGILLFGFVIAHMLGNLQVFSGPEKLNSYAKFLKDLGPVLWAARLFLLGAFVLHVVTAIRISTENKKARTQGYQVFNTKVASYASRTMIYSGIIVLSFLIYHLLHFTLGVTNPDFMELKDAQGRHDVYTMVVTGFKSLPVSIAYIVSMIVLCFHLNHGLFSLFQTLGVNSPQSDPLLKKVSLVISLLIFVGNTSMPVAVLMDVVKVTAIPSGGL
ncbi:MAG: succinate dehydrogenase cytochrome b subunit [Spirochaetota bacterium]